MFGEYGLRITIEANQTTVNFLDVTLDLADHTFKPYHKPNSTISYVHSSSNHPPSILKNIPLAVNDRLNRISSTQEIFDQAAPPFQAALKKSGYTHTLRYSEPTQNHRKKRNRNREVIWFNPPFTQNSTINIGRKFLQLLDECFPPDNPMHRILNRHTVKISYSCLPSFGHAIKAHNNKLLTPDTTSNSTDNRTCSCRTPADCPLDGNCLAKNIVYQATVTDTNTGNTETYVGSTSTDFKTRLGNHRQNFNNPDQLNRPSTKLSSHIWKLKKQNHQYTTTWKILKQVPPYKSGSKACNLCLFEKYIIVCCPNLCSLNSRNELLNLCRHRSKYLLKNYKNS